MMLALVLFSIALAVEPSCGHPLGIYTDTSRGFDVETEVDVYNGYNGPWNYGNRWWGGLRGLWPYDRYVDNIDYDVSYSYAAPIRTVDVEYNYAPPVRTVDVGRDRVVKDFQLTETDNWVRDQTTYRSQPRYRYATTYAAPRRVFSGGIGGPRTSSVRTGGDYLFLRR